MNKIFKYVYVGGISYLLLFLISLNCSSIGQFSYTKNGDKIELEEHLMYVPQMNGSGIRSGAPMSNYWEQSVVKVLMVSNPFNRYVEVNIQCDYTFPPNITVNIPPHKTQEVLITTTTEHMFDKLCREEEL